MLASVVDGMNAGGDGMNAGAAVNKRGDTASGNKNGVNMSTALSIVEMCYGDTGLLLSMPRQGLGTPPLLRWPMTSSYSVFTAPGPPWPLPNPAAAPIQRQFAPQRSQMAMIIS